MNSHAGRREYSGRPSEQLQARKFQILALSSSTAYSLEKSTLTLIEYLSRHKDAELADVAYTWRAGKKNLKHRRFVVCKNTEDALRFLQTNDPEHVFTSVVERRRPPVVFMFPGAGAQHVNMGRGLYQQEAVYREQIDTCARIIEPHVGFDLRDYLYAEGERIEEASERIWRPVGLLAGTFLTEYSLARLLMKWGVRPHAMIGLSLGEYVAACVAGVISLEEALSLVALRGQLFEQLPRGAMVSVALSEEEVLPLLSDNLSVAVINTPSLCVISGPIEELEEFENSLQSKGVPCRRLQVSGAGHSKMVEPMMGVFAEHAERVTQKTPAIPYLSNVTGKWITEAEIKEGRYWAKHLRQTVRLSDELTELLTGRDALLLEVGPGQTMCSLIKQHPARAARHVLLPCMKQLQQQQEDEEVLLNALGKLWLAGADVSWDSYYANQQCQMLRVPRYRIEVPQRRLTAGQVSGPNNGKRFVAARNATEERLQEIWREVFKVEQVSIDDNFFELGGHSLMAMRLFSRLRGAFGVALNLRVLLEKPTIAGLAIAIEEAITRGEDRQARAIEPVPHDGPLPLSYSQEQLWFLSRMEVGNPFYNATKAFSIAGELDTQILEKSINEIIRRHEILRTIFPEVEGQPVQVIAPALSISVPVDELTKLDEAERRAEVMKRAREEAQRPFDLEHLPLIRLRLLKVAEREHVFLLTLHHIIADGWSLSVLIKEMATLYGWYRQGGDLCLKELPVQYADYAVWQRKRFDAPQMNKLLEYWEGKMSGAPAVLELPADRKRPEVQTYRGGRRPFKVSNEMSRQIKEFSRAQGVTQFITLQAAYKTLLYRYSGQKDIVIGSPVAGRDQAEIEGLIGLFVNMLALRTRLSGEWTFRQLLENVRVETLDAYAHQEFPFEKLVERMGTERSLKYTPIFQAVFAFQNSPVEETEEAGLKWSEIDIDSGTSKFDLTLFMWEGKDGLAGAIEYNTDIYEERTVSRMLEHFQCLLTAIASDPDQLISRLPMLPQRERAQLLSAFNDTGADYASGVCVHEMFERHALMRPDKLAVEMGGESLTYWQLNSRANQLAHLLIGFGLRPEFTAAIYLPRCPEMIVAMLATLKAGGAYVPIDVSLPPQRVDLMIADSRAQIILTHEHLLAPLQGRSSQAVALDSDELRINSLPDSNPGRLIDAANLAYIIYTSGSTGRPKGVAVEHRSLVNLISWHHRQYDVRESDRASQLASPSFDASVWEVWPYLTAGASLHIVGEEARTSPDELMRWLINNRISISFMPTPLAERLLEQQWPDDSALRVMLTGGDKLHNPARKRWPFELFNNYGPTENTVVATSAAVRPCALAGSAPPIGKPIANTQVYVLDEQLEPVPIGVAGELYIAGESLARGYYDRADLTAERFIANRFAADGGRMYRTGDLVRYREDGDIDYLGRADKQVKIRGMRVELGEIEEALREQVSVAEAVVELEQTTDGVKRLVGYVVMCGEKKVSTAEMRRGLKQRLPDYMVPAVLVELEQMPTNSSGKIDRQALAQAARPTRDPLAVDERPRTKVEESLAQIWTELLGAEQIGINDDFFELGGHSLLATKLISRVRETFQLEIPLRRVFEARTISGLASIISHSEGERDKKRFSSIDQISRGSAESILGKLSQFSDEEVDILLSGMLTERAANE